MRILYVNELAEVSGGERSLLELIEALGSQVDPVLACPPGPLLEEASRRGIETRAIPGTSLSFRLHPVNTVRGAASLVRMAARVRALGRELRPALVHANSARAGLAVALAARTGGPPAITHVRDWAPPGRVGRVALGAVMRGSDRVIANSRYIADSLPAPRGRPPVEVIHNPVDVARFDPDSIDRDSARARLGLGAGDVVLSVVAHFIPWKAQDDAVRVLARLRPQRPGVRLVLAGSAKFAAPGRRFDMAAYERELHALVAAEGVEREVLFAGERDDVPEVLRATDVLLVPSWQEAFGRIVVEGMAMGVPVVATSRGGPAEIIRDGVDGQLLAPRDPERWAEVVAGLIDRPALRAELGDCGRRRAASEFTPARHAERVLAVYRDLAGGA